MAWVRINDGFFRHPAVRCAGKDGAALFIAGLCWLAKDLAKGAMHPDLWEASCRG